MSDLETLIAEWRRQLEPGPDVGPETLEELESHLRESVAQLISSGLDETTAFRRAAAQLGPVSAVAAEFGKLDQSPWFPARVMIGAGVAVALMHATYLGVRVSRGLEVMLAGHIFALTLGYVGALLTGTLGICFAFQRCLGDMSEQRLRSVRQISGRFAATAAGLVGIGIVLGMIWSSGRLGRLWEWNSSETAALSELVWLILFAGFHQVRGISGRAVLLLGIVGNAFVAVAWLGPFVAASARGHGGPASLAVLVAMLTAHALFLAAGLAPAGCWRAIRTRVE